MIMILVSKDKKGIPSSNTFVGWQNDGSNFSIFLPWVSGWLVVLIVYLHFCLDFSLVYLN